MTRRNLLLAGMTIALSFGALAPAHALPGQSVDTVLKWANSHKVLSPLTRGIGELSGQPYYTTQAKTEAGNFVFTMNPDKNQAKEETIALRTSKFSQMIFTRTNPTGLTLIQQVYNSPLATDFRNAKYIANVDFLGQQLRFYEGKNYGYITTEFKQPSEGQRFYHFSVVSKSDLKPILASDRACQQRNPAGCE